MTNMGKAYQEAENKAYKMKWKVTKCFRGVGGNPCWCAGIDTVKKLRYEWKTEDGIIIHETFEVVPLGNIDKRLARYIVKLHNANIEK